MTSRRRTAPNRRWNNVVYVSVEIYNVQQCWNKVVYFNVELSNVRHRQNNAVILNVDFHNVGQRRKNVANMRTKYGYSCKNSYLQPPCLDVGKGFEYASAECKVNCLTRFCSLSVSLSFSILCLKSYVYFAISVQLDFHSRP